MDSETIKVGTRVWFDAARQLWLKEFPERDCPIPSYDDLDLRGKAFFEKVISRVLVAASPQNVKEVRKRYEAAGKEL